ncbi:DNA primase [Auraticoccus monumenti]|uniref:DNA primase n=1 Tax=Auraticoccus monumenti TaxID=675864 RepID=A0A1G7EBG3_9ACTN|nr:DNA primase [Auraticoccus monumenti]SDE60967.1 DNA primase [Auraticoccus monumenti]
MAGRINDEDVAEVRERARIDEVIGSHVALRGAGSGSLKGLCPFHDEKTPSFQVTPARGFYYCFGCGEGGDVISFVQKVDNLSFAEAVQQLADRVGVQLRYTEGDGPGPAPGLRLRLLAANKAAEEYFSEQLTSADALAARQFLHQRGFDREAAERFGVGYAPRAGRALGQHLKGRGFSEAELVRAGLVRERGGFDFFQGRLLWPIRDSGSQVLGFGGRRLYDDDRMPAKYLNTPESPVYKKSQVLYGLDLARTQIGKKGQAVVVEGYTDVMAAHLSGVDTAVASCGTAFGDDHARMLQRLMGHSDAFHGEVVFTFDGDAAGQAAALKVFDGDANFISQTYVAVEPSGLDPCDLRLEHGDAAVRELVARRVPLYRFVMGNVLSQYDLDRADGRLQALRAAAPLVSSIRDSSLVGGYARELAGMLGMDVEEVRSELTRAQRVAGSRQGSSRGRVEGTRPGAGTSEEEPSDADAGRSVTPLPDPADHRLLVERETCQLIVQRPDLFDATLSGLDPGEFTHPAYAGLVVAMHAALTSEGTADWVSDIRAATEDPVVEQLAVALAVEPLRRADADQGYADVHVARVKLLAVSRSIADVKSRLQRTNPVEQTTRYNQMFSTLLGLEALRKELQVKSIGARD